MITRHAVCFSMLAACGGANVEPAQPTTSASASARATPTSPTAIASTTPAPSDVRLAPPANFRVLQGEGFSIYVPAAWQPIQAPPGAQAFASYSGADESMSLQIAKVAFVGAENEFVTGVTKGVTNSGATETGTNALSIAGRSVPLTAFVSTKAGPVIRGAMRLATGVDSVVVVTCHTSETGWNDKARADCDPMFASLKLGAAAHTTAPPRAGKRFLAGNDFRVEVPAAWTDDTAHNPDVHALARSSNDENTMVVVTIAEIAPDEKPTPQSRDATLQKTAKLVLGKEGTHGAIKHVAPNAIDIDFTRQLAGQTTALVNAHFFAKDAAYLVTCGGLRPTLEAHNDICDTAIRSMRLENPK